MANPRILVVDIGNTSTSLGVYQRGRVLRPVHFDSANATRAGMARAVRRAAGRVRLDGAMVASVVPRLNTAWRTTLRRHVDGPVEFVRSSLRFGIPVTYPQPATIGADRLANACGGAVRYGTPLIVADFGTAVTFDLVTRSQGYVGGIIGPGLPLMFSYMKEKTAQLPLIGPGAVRGRIGKSTKQAMQLGAQWGYRGLVREVLAELRRDPALRRARVCATGGFAHWIVRGLNESIPVDQDLTLFGLGRIFELNFVKRDGNA